MIAYQNGGPVLINIHAQPFHRWMLINPDIQVLYAMVSVQKTLIKIAEH